MAEATVTAKKAKPAVAPGAAAFEMPKFGMPNFEFPKFDATKFEFPQVDVPVAFREMAEKSVAQAKDTYEKIKVAAEETTDLIEDTYTTAAKGVAEYNLKALEAARENLNSAFDYAREVMQVKTLSEAVELSSAHMRKQFDTLSAQAKDLQAIAQKVATETAEPVKASFNKAVKAAS